MPNTNTNNEVTLTEAGRSARNSYMRAYRRRNKDKLKNKTKQSEVRRWNRLGEIMTSENLTDDDLLELIALKRHLRDEENRA